jgi:hypothetical protein
MQLPVVGWSLLHYASWPVFILLERGARTGHFSYVLFPSAVLNVMQQFFNQSAGSSGFLSVSFTPWL